MCLHKDTMIHVCKQTTIKSTLSHTYHCNHKRHDLMQAAVNSVTCAVTMHETTCYYKLQMFTTIMVCCYSFNSLPFAISTSVYVFGIYLCFELFDSVIIVQ